MSGRPLPYQVRIPSAAVRLDGELCAGPQTRAIVLFTQPSGSSHYSPRNQYLARTIREAGMGTLLLDLLTREEQKADRQTRAQRFNVGLLAQRLAHATDWLATHPGLAEIRIGYFGVSVGGGAALVAAAALPERIGAVVSRGGRPDLAKSALSLVGCPTLLIVGGRDEGVIELNQQAYAQLHCLKRLEVIAGATPLCEEPRALEEVAPLATAWFHTHLHSATVPR